MNRITQETILAMELNRSHIGKLVQMITDSWSLTGTLASVDQHDNREWETRYPVRALVPVAGEIYSVVTIGPWTGRVMGNQPVTVETVAGTLEAPEWQRLTGGGGPAKSGYVVDERTALALTEPGDLEWTVVDDLPSTRYDVHLLGADRRFTLCGQRLEPDGHWIPERMNVTQTSGDVTCRVCKRRHDLLPEPPAEWHKG